LSHIKEGHPNILKPALGVIVGFFIGSTGITLSDDYDLTGNFKKIIRMIYTSPLLYYFSAKLIWCAISRYCEKQADLTAAAAVGAEGGIAFFGRFINEHKTGLFDSHPSALDRVEYLQAFKN
jgi:Zn-dependent protease with chaperone function